MGAGKGAWTGATKYFGVPRPGLRGTTPGGMATGAPSDGACARTAAFAEAPAGVADAATAGFDAGRGAGVRIGAADAGFVAVEAGFVAAEAGFAAAGAGCAAGFFTAGFVAAGLALP